MKQWIRPSVYGLASAAVCFGVLIWFNAREREARRIEQDRDTRVIALQFARHLRGSLEEHRIAIAQFASYFANSREVTSQEFDSYAAATAPLTPHCLRIAFVDEDLVVRWVHPPEHAGALVGFNVRSHGEGYEAVARARDTGGAHLSAPLELVRDEKGIVLLSPVFKHGEFRGEVGCSLRATFLEAMVLPEIRERYEVVVQDGATDIFRTEGWGREDHSAYFTTIDFGGRTWGIRIRPKQAVILARVRSGEGLFWTLGGMVSILIGTLVAVGAQHGIALTRTLRSREMALAHTREQLDDAMMQLLQAEKLSALGELVAGVAHEVNNPLTTILGFAQLTLRLDVPAEARRPLETISSEAQRAGRIVRSLLTFARKHPPEKKFIGLNGIIEKTLELKAYSFKAGRIEVRRVLDPGLPKTMLDFHQIQQVVLNLLNNAEHAIRDAGGKGVITLETRVRHGRIVLVVSDSGPGVPAAVRNRIFEPFFTTKKEGKGTGLGLSVCYGIIREHQGSIRVEGQEGEGAIFIVELPVVGPIDGVAPRAPEGDAVFPRASAVLVVDDDQNIQDFLLDLLTSAGHRVDTASDVPEALRKLEANTYDLVITDMKMANGTGRDVCEAIARQRRSPGTPVILTTGDGAGEGIEADLHPAACDLLEKPFRLEDVERAVGRALSGLR